MNHRMAIRILIRKHGHNLQQISTVVQSEYYQRRVSIGDSREREGKGHTVSQLFDAQSAHLLTATLPKAAVSQVFLNTVA